MLINTNRYSCKDCANRGTGLNGSPACSLNQKLIDINKDFCSNHKVNTNNITCRICGKPQIDFIYPFEDKYLLLCADCNKYIGSCNSCIYVNNCGLKSDHSEPLYVTKTIRNGMGVIQTQVKNPNLIQKHCLSCRCGWEETCLKEQNEGNCSSWTPLPELLQ